MSFRKSLVATTAIVAVLATSACQTTNRDIGRVVGAVAGVAIGSAFGQGAGKIAAIALGGVIGGVIGDMIGSMLDEQEQAQVSRQAGQALGSARDGETITWSNPDSGAAARITPVSTGTAERRVAIVRDRAVQAPASLEVLGETWITDKSANLRAAPTTEAAVVGGLKAGERFQAIGRVAGSDWIMVGRNNRTIGYVYEPLVRKAPSVQTASTDLDQLAVTDQRVGLTQSRDLDTMLADARTSAAAGSADSTNLDDLVVEEVAATTQCRDMRMEVSKNGENATEQATVCKSGDGMWEII
ncbi:SH3 domain-containing protein [Caenispirillum bisanense]|uniref:Surface antigen n=1 Tax=Caenispirillum bisanense TaxID=414052 RepID=A0A286GIZ1_9PROT|nr:SH3 domain-containing protein [Caenispirillum bisanense]SOD95501.1 Surface antigen [Caenispirillum bisanense]